jgi:hypothetical protein
MKVKHIENWKKARFISTYKLYDELQQIINYLRSTRAPKERISRYEETKRQLREELKQQCC